MKKITLFVLLFLFAGCIAAQEGQKKYFGKQDEILPDKALTMQNQKDWYKDAVFYHIWVKSFNDSDGNGIGDLKGIIQKLDYLNDGDSSTDSDLGIDAIWLSPVFECYFKGDNMHGYDTVDYYKVNEVFGTNADLEELLIEAHKRGIRIVFDFVINHTSNMHPWFIDSMQNTGKRDWYIWEKKPSSKYKQAWGGGNWKNVWHEYDEEYYYGAFWSGMPDLNYDNKEVREVMANTLIYWLNKGFDGIRIDASRYIVERGPMKQADQPDNHLFFQKLRSELLDKYEESGSSKMMVGENWTHARNIGLYYGNGTNEFHMNFDFPLAYAIRDSIKSRGDFSKISDHFQLISEYYPEGYQNANFLGNHDEVTERLGTEYSDISQAKTASALLLLLPGTPFIYYGNEIAMPNQNLSGDIRLRGMLDWNEISRQQKNIDSILNLNKNLIRLRKNKNFISTGQFISLPADKEGVFAYAVKGNTEYAVFVFNLKEKNLNVSVDLSVLNTDISGFKNLLSGKTAFKIENSKLNISNLKSFDFIAAGM